MTLHSLRQLAFHGLARRLRQQQDGQRLGQRSGRRLHHPHAAQAFHQGAVPLRVAGRTEQATVANLAEATDPELQHRAIGTRTSARRAAQLFFQRRLDRSRVAAIQRLLDLRHLCRQRRSVPDGLRRQQGERFLAGVARHQAGSAEQSGQGVAGGEAPLQAGRAPSTGQLAIHQNRHSRHPAVGHQRRCQALRRNIERVHRQAQRRPAAIARHGAGRRQQHAETEQRHCARPCHPEDRHQRIPVRTTRFRPDGHHPGGTS